MNRLPFTLWPFVATLLLALSGVSDVTAGEPSDSRDPVDVAADAATIADSGATGQGEVDAISATEADDSAADNSETDDSEADGHVSFCQQIAPLLVDRCITCHGERDAQSEYSLFNHEMLRMSGSSGAEPIDPGNLDDSYLFELVSAEDPDFWMPHKKPRLAEDQIHLLRRWIESGAEFDGEDSTTPLWQLVPPATYPPPREPTSAIPITAVAFSPDGNQMAISGLHEILIVDPRTGQLVRRIHNVAERTYDLAFHPESGQIVAASGSPGQLGEVRVYDAATGEMVRELARFRDVALGLAFDESGTRLACCGADSTIRIHDFATGDELLVAQHHADWVYRVSFSADGKRIVSASRDMTAKVIDAETGDLVTTYNAHQAPVNDAAFLPGGEQAISCGQEKRSTIGQRPARARPQPCRRRHRMKRRFPRSLVSLATFTEWR